MRLVAIAWRPVAGADMPKPTLDVAAEIAQLGLLTLFELRAEWRRLHRLQPPMRLSRDLLIRGITYKLQERALGGLSRSLMRKLEPSGAPPQEDQTRTRSPPITLKAGTRLVREWHGKTHTVLVHADGVEWKGRLYPSLSIVAREITGAHWSGPRFFGLRPRSTASAISDAET